jgi:hypothetical protein
MTHRTHACRWGTLAICQLLAWAALVTNAHAQHLHPHNAAVVFTDHDFQIIRNYVMLKAATRSNTCDYLDAATGRHFFYTSNGHGWEAIRIRDSLYHNIDYYLNYQRVPADGAHDHVIVVTSNAGERSNERALLHFGIIISDIKRSLLVSRYFQLLFGFYLRAGKMGEDFHYAGRVIGLSQPEPGVRVLSVIPETGLHDAAFVPYRMEERLTRRRSRVQWQYLVDREELLADDFFFHHYTHQLAEIVCGGNVKDSDALVGH